MAQEIYHRSNWGNPTETWGNTYLNADLTNELYKRASEYENSWVTDQLLNGVGTKPSIILTPTAYEDGILNSVKPAKTFGNDLSGGVDNYDNLYGSTTVTDGSANILSTGSLSGLGWSNILTVGRKYKFSYNVTDSTSGQIKITGGSSDINLDSTVGSHFIEFTSAYVYFNILRVASCDITINNISLQLITEADFDFTRGSSATRVNEQGLVSDVQILSGELVQNGNFEQIGSELMPSIATIENNNGGIITQINGNSYSSTSDGTSSSSIRPKFDFATTSGKIYKLVITPTGTITGTVNFDFYDGSTYLFHNYDFTTTKEVYFKDNGGVFGAFDGTQTYSISNFTISVKEVGQNWTVTNDDANNYVEFNQEEGTVRLKFLNTSPLTTLASDTQYLSGKKYKLTVDVAEAVSGGIKIDAAGVSELFNSVGIQERIIEPTGNAYISFYRATANVDITLNSVSLIEITDDTDLPRINYTNFDYDNGEVVPYSGEGSLLLEPQSTNLITYSEDFSSLNIRNNAVVTSNAIISPSGMLDADEITFDGTAYGRVEQTISVTVGQSYTISLYLKNKDLSDKTQVWLGFSQSSQGYYVTITDEWQRYDITTTADGTSEYPRIQFSGTGSLYAWGFQVEALSYATSYIPTNGSTKTRNADVCNNSGNSDLINSTEGVLYAEISALANDGTNRTIALNKDSNDRIQMYFDTADNSLSIFYKAQGTHTFGMNETLSDATEFNKIAFKWKTNDFALWVNGIETDTVSSGVTSNADTLNALEFEMFNNFASFYGNVKCVAVFKEALSDTELEKLTTI